MERSEEITNTRFLTGQRALLAPYVTTPKTYHYPADGSMQAIRCVTADGIFMLYRSILISFDVFACRWVTREVLCFLSGGRVGNEINERSFISYLIGVDVVLVGGLFFLC